MCFMVFFFGGAVMFFSDLNMTFSTFFVLLFILMKYKRESIVKWSYTTYTHHL